MAMELSGARPIVMEPPFVETFCNTESSNFTMSKDTFVHLQKVRSNEISAAPRNKFRKPAFERSPDTDDQNCDVIVTATFIRAAYEPFRGALNTGSLRQKPSNLVFRYHAGEPIGTEQQRIAWQ